MASVDLETIFIDIMDEVLDYIPEADHLELIESLLQKLVDGGYNLKILYGHNEIYDEALNTIYDNTEQEFGEEYLD